MHRTLAASPQAAANKLRKSKAPAPSQSEPQRRSERIANSPAQSGWTRRSPLGSAIVKASAPVPSGRLAPARTCGVPGFPCRSQRCRGLCLRPLRFLRTATAPPPPRRRRRPQRRPPSRKPAGRRRRLARSCRPCAFNDASPRRLPCPRSACRFARQPATTAEASARQRATYNLVLVSRRRYLTIPTE